ncbi:histidine kinase famiy protein [Noviherbaspirillum pedocola]|uniref:histidine kinase n=1 Tax=Noviherbaspirillum pedocola TaxID=2801341 RepID=A0A934W727_9BURK|nr:histidine kinase famiy protein [Noviherbaspirillum pedocola]MBK4735865.1 PAS domain-containing protein [Noviherbaspirillum pedocola]
MATGSNNDGNGPDGLDQQGGGQSFGRPADGQLETGTSVPLGNPGIRHWQAGYISKPGLQDRSNVFFAAVEMTRMPMLVTDPNQRDNPIVFVNRAFLDLTGYSEDQVLGRNCRFLQGEETDRGTVSELRNAIRENRAVAVDILNYKADGTPFWNALFIGPIFDQEGQILYFFASQLDITRRRLSEQSYLQAQKMEAIGQLTAGLAHDFNNLLQIVAGNLEMARHTIHDPVSADESIALAQQAVERAGRLTQQLLTFARKQHLDPKRANLNALVVEFSEILVRTLGKKVTLKLDLKPGLPSCVIDSTHFEMALLNVLINARDAMPDGGTVVVETSLLEDAERMEMHRLPPGRYVVLCVTDEGRGMSRDVARRATEPFFTTKGPGTGLGLAMVHGFVQQSNGRLEIDSEVGKGTTIRMIFPVAGASPIEIMAERRQEGGVTARSGWSPKAILERRTILVGDDSEDVLKLTSDFLQRQDYRVLSARSAEEALELVDRYGAVDMLFTDVIMPGGMNGLQLVERLRERWPGLPVLLATGYIEEVPTKDKTNASIPILTKPYSQAQLIEHLRAVLASPAQENMASTFRHEG